MIQIGNTNAHKARADTTLLYVVFLTRVWNHLTIIVRGVNKLWFCNFYYYSVLAATFEPLQFFIVYSRVRHLDFSWLEAAGGDFT